jgi:DNA-binding transcriptional ArsR family regulator
MFDETSEDLALAAVFKALGDPTRLRIFRFLACCDRTVAIDEEGRCRPAGSRSVGEVCCRFEQSMSTISHHLKELRLAGLIQTEKQGRWIYCSVNPATLDQIQAFLHEQRSAADAPLETCCR